jgi:hypothetical protein
MRPIWVFSPIFLIIGQAAMPQLFGRHAHGQRVAGMRAIAIGLCLLIRMKSFVATLADTILDACRFLITTARAILIALLGTLILPCFSADGTCANFYGSRVPTFAGAVSTPPGRQAARRHIEFFMAGRACFKHSLIILISHQKSRSNS